jgi:hypothetical protein
MEKIEEKAQRVLNDLYHRDDISVQELNTLVSYINWLKTQVDEYYEQRRTNEKK